MSVFVDCETTPTAFTYDPFEESLIVCEPTERASRNCVKKYTSSTSRLTNFRQDETFSRPSKTVVNINSDVVISDAGAKSLTIVEQSGGVKSRFTGNDEIQLYPKYTFTCDMQGNILIVSQNETNYDDNGNLCLLDENGHFIDTCNVGEIRNHYVTDIAVTDIGFVWISCEAGVYIFDYQFA